MNKGDRDPFLPLIFAILWSYLARAVLTPLRLKVMQCDAWGFEKNVSHREELK